MPAEAADPPRHLWVDEIEAAHDEVISLGATLLKEAAGGDSPDDFRVYADPAGHPFCLCWVRRRTAH